MTELPVSLEPYQASSSTSKAALHNCSLFRHMGLCVVFGIHAEHDPLTSHSDLNPLEWYDMFQPAVFFPQLFLYQNMGDRQLLRGIEICEFSGMCSILWLGLMHKLCVMFQRLIQGAEPNYGRCRGDQVLHKALQLWGWHIHPTIMPL